MWSCSSIGNGMAGRAGWACTPCAAGIAACAFCPAGISFRHASFPVTNCQRPLVQRRLSSVLPRWFSWDQQEWGQKQKGLLLWTFLTVAVNSVSIIYRKYHRFENPHRLWVWVSISWPTTKPTPTGRLHGFTLYQYRFYYTRPHTLIIITYKFMSVLPLQDGSWWPLKNEKSHFVVPLKDGKILWCPLILGITKPTYKGYDASCISWDLSSSWRKTHFLSSTIPVTGTKP